MNPISIVSVPAATLYAVIHNPDGRVWNMVTSEWEVYNSARWAQYAVPLTEQGVATGFYTAAYPITDPGALTLEVAYIQAGVAPAEGDPAVAAPIQSQGVSVGAIAASIEAAARLALSLGGMITGAVTSLVPATETVFPVDLDDTTDDVYIGRLVLFTSGNLVRQVGNISAYDAAAHTLTVAGPFTSAPGVADKFIIV